MRLLPHRTRLLVHKKLLGILTLLFALAGVLQPLEAHNASIAACRKLADSGWDKNEQAVWDKICEAKDADLSKTDENCKAEGAGSESDNNNCKGSLKAGFLHDILFQKCYRDVIGPRGVHIKKAKFAKVDLSWGKIPWPLRLESCSLQSLNMNSLVAEREIVLTDSEISDCLNFQSASIQRDLILDDLKMTKASANLTAARIGGNLSMANARFRNLDLIFASVGARLDGNTFANISRQSITGSLIQNHIEHMLASPEMPASSGVTAKSDPLTTKGDLIMSGTSITGKADFSGTQVNGRLHLWKDAGKEGKNEKGKAYNLHGLIYDEAVPQNNGKSNEEILDEFKNWLDKDTSGSVQPYMYLASRLRAKNNFYISEQILHAGQKLVAQKRNNITLSRKSWLYEFLNFLLSQIDILHKQVFNMTNAKWFLIPIVILLIAFVVEIKKCESIRDAWETLLLLPWSPWKNEANACWLRFLLKIISLIVSIALIVAGLIWIAKHFINASFLYLKTLHFLFMDF